MTEKELQDRIESQALQFRDKWADQALREVGGWRSGNGDWWREDDPEVLLQLILAALKRAYTLGVQAATGAMALAEEVRE